MKRNKKEHPKKPLWKRILIDIAAFTGAGAVTLGAATLIMYLQPLSKAYALHIDSEPFVFHTGDSDLIRYHFSEETDIPYLLMLQKPKLEELVFESADTAVSEVDENGFVRASGKGCTEIALSVDDLRETVQITSYARGEKLNFPENLFNLNVGDTMYLRAGKSPADAVLFEEITYSVSNEEIISIDEKSGYLEALNPGWAFVYAEADGIRTATEIDVYQPMTGIAFRERSWDDVLHIERGDSFSFPISFFPANTTDPRDVTYTLSDPSMGTVDEKGVFTASGRGPVTLTAECNGFTDSVDIEIHVTLAGIGINHEELTLIYQTQDHLTYEVFPADTTDSLSCSLVSENPDVVTIDDNGIITAVGPGSAAVTVKVNEFEKSCMVTVLVPVTAVNISPTSVVLNPGDNYTISASLYPEFTTDEHTVTWTTENAGVVTVDQNGNIHAVNPGQAWVFATHGDVANGCLVKVRTPHAIIADRIISFGRQFLGTPYVYGGNSLRGGIDCSSFTMQCFASQGIYLPRTSGAQSGCGAAIPVDAAQWLPGDLIFYAPHGYISHVAIYIGNGEILQSSQSMGGVCITPYNYNGYTPAAVRRCF